MRRVYCNQHEKLLLTSVSSRLFLRFLQFCANIEHSADYTLITCNNSSSISDNLQSRPRWELPPFIKTVIFIPIDFLQNAYASAGWAVHDLACKKTKARTRRVFYFVRKKSISKNLKFILSMSLNSKIGFVSLFSSVLS